MKICEDCSCIWIGGGEEENVEDAEQAGEAEGENGKEKPWSTKTGWLLEIKLVNKRCG